MPRIKRYCPRHTVRGALRGGILMHETRKGSERGCVRERGREREREREREKRD